MDIFLRPPSVSWEPVQLPAAPGAVVWAWLRPPNAPYGIVLQVPLESLAAHPRLFTIRILLTALGVDCRLIRMCITGVAVFDAMQGMNPLLDQPLSIPPDGGAPTVTAHVAPPLAHSALSAVACNSFPLMPSHGAGRGSDAIYHAIESDWHAIQILESKNLLLRQQMNSTLTKLMSLNRDLSPEERNASDALDHRDWQDARRWIRDGVAVLSRVVRAHDIGATSAAGNRNRFDDIIHRHITPRHPLPNLVEVQHQFESHRKVVQSLHAEMQSAMHGPAREGEVKAQNVLNRIRTKLHSARGRR